MKNTLLIIFTVLAFFGCSVESLDSYQEENLNLKLEKDTYANNQGLKRITDVDDCITSHNFDDAGTIEVTNDGEYLLVTIAASGSFSLIETRLQVSRSYDDFPTVGSGNLPPAKMAIHKKFQSGLQDYTWQFPLSDYKGLVTIASFSKFTNADGSIEVWAGDKEVKFGNWAYFEYEIIECSPSCETPDLGEDVILNYSYNESLSINEEELMEALGFDDNGYPTDGSFEPSLETVVGQVQSNPGGDVFSVSTAYNVGEGECEESVELIVNVACPNAGADQYGTLEFNCAENLDGLGHLRNIYLGLLEDGVKTDGSFVPTMEDISKKFEGAARNGGESAVIGELFTTEYTVGFGECVDTVELTIEIIESNDEEGECEAYKDLKD